MSKLFVTSILMFASSLASAHQFEPAPTITPELARRATESREVIEHTTPYEEYVYDMDGYAAAAAATSLDCQMMLIPSLPRFKTKHLPIELREAAGLIVRRGERLPALESGLYLWQVWRNGDLVILSRNAWEKFVATGVGVNTHEAFELLHQQTYGYPIGNDVLASGELRTAFGEIFYINNKSGKWPGPAESMAFGERVLLDRGAITNEMTKRHVMNREFRLDTGHQPEDREYDEWQGSLESAVNSEPGGKQLVSLYNRLGRVLRRFAEGEQARDLEHFVITGLGRNRARFAASNLQYVFRSALTTEGIYFAVNKHFEYLANAEFPPEHDKDALPRVVDAFLKELAAQLTADEKAELESIRDDFAKVPDRQGPYFGIGPGSKFDRPRDVARENPIKF